MAHPLRRSEGPLLVAEAAVCDGCVMRGSFWV